MSSVLHEAIAEIADLASVIVSDRRLVLAWMAEVPIAALGARTALDLAEDGQGGAVSAVLSMWIALENPHTAFA